MFLILIPIAASPIIYERFYKDSPISAKTIPLPHDNSEPEPDIAIVRLPSTIYRAHHPYAEDIYWLIEVSSRTLKIDLEQKAITYARNTIPEYWVLDLVNNQLIVHRHPQGNRYSQVVNYRVGVISPQAFPEIKIALDQLLLF